MKKSLREIKTSPITTTILEKTKSTDNVPLPKTPPPLLNITKIRKGLPIPKPVARPISNLKIGIPSRNLTSPIQSEKPYNAEIRELNPKLKSKGKIYKDIVNKLKSYEYFEHIINNVSKLKISINPQHDSQEKLVENIRHMNNTDRIKLLDKLKQIFNDGYTLAWEIVKKNNEKVLAKGRGLLGDQELSVLRPIFDAESNIIVQLVEVKYELFKNVLKNFLFSKMKHPEWNKDLINELFEILEKWNLIVKVGDKPIPRNWDIDNGIKNIWLPQNKNLNPRTVLNNISNDLEGEWSKNVMMINDYWKSDRYKNKHSGEQDAKNWIATHDGRTKKPLDSRLGPVKIYGNKGLELDPEASAVWDAQLGLEDNDKKMSSGSDVSVLSSSSSTQSSSKGFFGGKRRKRSRRKSKRGKGRTPQKKKTKKKKKVLGSPPRKSWSKKPHEQKLGKIFEEAATIEKVSPNDILNRPRPVVTSVVTLPDARLKARMRKIQKTMETNPGVYETPKGGKRRKQSRKKRKRKRKRKKTRRKRGR